MLRRKPKLQIARAAFGTLKKQAECSEEDFEKALHRAIVMIRLTTKAFRQRSIKGKPLRRDMRQRKTCALA
ncbi:hypothetical protein D3C86_1248240 [compost metagenome]